jgi:hypothetical protein
MADARFGANRLKITHQRGSIGDGISLLIRLNQQKGKIKKLQ